MLRYNGDIKSLMKYLLPSQLDTSVRPNHPIEQFISVFEENGYKALRWISIEKSKDRFELVLHEVFDDSTDGIESIYDYSYVEPDDIHGRSVFASISLLEILEYAIDQYGATNNKYLNFGFLDELLIKGSQSTSHE